MPAPQPSRGGFRRYLPGAAAVAIALIGLLVVVIVGGPKSSPSLTEKLAADQTLSFPIAQDVSDLDPALISAPADVDILRNVFSGLYKFDAQLHEEPDLSAGHPTASPD